MPTLTVPDLRQTNRASAAAELPDFDAALRHAEAAYQSVFECVSHIPDDFYAHKCMEDHADIVARLTSLKAALRDRRSQLQILTEGAAR